MSAQGNDDFNLIFLNAKIKEGVHDPGNKYVPPGPEPGVVRDNHSDFFVFDVWGRVAFDSLGNDLPDRIVAHCRDIPSKDDVMHFFIIKGDVKGGLAFFQFDFHVCFNAE
jgi:hypothetical protein